MEWWWESAVPGAGRRGRRCCSGEGKVEVARSVDMGGRAAAEDRRARGPGHAAAKGRLACWSGRASTGGRLGLTPPVD